MPIEIETEIGIVEFPDGTPVEVMEEAIKQSIAEEKGLVDPASGERIPAGFEEANALVRSLAKGLTAGQSDRVAGFLRALTEDPEGTLSLLEGVSAEEIQQKVDEEQALTSALERENPGITIGSEIVGAVVGPGKLIKGAGLGAKSATSGLGGITQFLAQHGAQTATAGVVGAGFASGEEGDVGTGAKIGAGLQAFGPIGLAASKLPIGIKGAQALLKNTFVGKAVSQAFPGAAETVESGLKTALKVGEEIATKAPSAAIPTATKVAAEAEKKEKKTPGKFKVE
jgi:hypothetical protein